MVFLGDIPSTSKTGRGFPMIKKTKIEAVHSAKRVGPDSDKIRHIEPDSDKIRHIEPR